MIKIILCGSRDKDINIKLLIERNLKISRGDRKINTLRHVQFQKSAKEILET